MKNPPPPMTNSSPTVNLHSGLVWEWTPNPPSPAHPRLPLSPTTISSYHQGPPEATPHTAGNFNPPVLDMAIPTPTLACPQPLPCAPAPQPRWPSLSAKLHRLLLCPITPPPPPLRYSNPDFPLLHIYLPPSAPPTGVPYFLYFIPHILTLYPPLLPPFLISCIVSFFIVNTFDIV